MERKKIQVFRERLLKQKDSLDGQIERMENWGLNENLKDSIGELSSYDNHTSDISDATFERAKDIALRDTSRILENKVEEALRKIDEGSYGICAKCGANISQERLEALPYATLCLECQKNFDIDRANLRPLEEDVFPHSFGDVTNEDNPEGKTYTDGEDIQQIMEQYGTANSPQDIPGTISYKDMVKEGDESLGVVQSVENVTQEEYDEAMKYES